MWIAASASCATLAGLALVAGCGSSAGGQVERSLTDPSGDVSASSGPDIVAVTVARDKGSITFRVRFATAPPLGISTERGWVDMLLIGIDVPPFGAPPASPGGEWRGANYALGTHGPTGQGVLVRLVGDASSGQARTGKVAGMPVERTGTTLSFRVARNALGDPQTLALSIAAAREWNQPSDEPAGARPEVVPDSGTWTVRFDS